MERVTVHGWNGLGNGCTDGRTALSHFAQLSRALTDGPEVTCSKTDIQGGTSGGIPVGIAIARQRVQPTNPSSPLTVQLTACQERGPQSSPWPSSLVQSYQYQIRDPDLGMTAIQPPFQLARDPVTGQYVLLPTVPSALEGAVQRALWAGPPALQVMHHPHHQPHHHQPLLMDRLVTLAPSTSQLDKRQSDCLNSVIHLPCDYAKASSAAAQQGLLIQPTMAPHQAFSTLLVHSVPFAPAPSTTHQNSFLLSTQLTEQALINQGSVVISNHMENTLMNPNQIIGNCSEGNFNSLNANAHVQTNLLQHHLSPSVVISSHTETNSYVRDLAPSIATGIETHLLEPEIKSRASCVIHKMTPVSDIDMNTQLAPTEYFEDDSTSTTIVADAQNQTDTLSISEEEETQGHVKLETEMSSPVDSELLGEEDQETSVVQQETTQIVTTQITRTTWTTEPSGTLQIEQEEVEEVVEQEQESQGSSAAVDLSGLELLSNTTIAQHEHCQSSPEHEDNVETSRGSDMRGLAVLCQAADFAMNQTRYIPVASSTSSSIVFRESSLTTSAILSTTNISSIGVDETPKSDVSSPQRSCKEMTAKEVPLKDAVKALRARKVKDKLSSVVTSQSLDEETNTTEPPVLEPWSAAPQRVTPRLSPPTLTPNKKRAGRESYSAEEADLQCSIPPPLKKRKLGITANISENHEKAENTNYGQTSESPPPPSLSSDAPKHKIRPKLKAEAKVKEPDDDNEDEILEPSLGVLAPDILKSCSSRQPKARFGKKPAAQKANASPSKTFPLKKTKGSAASSSETLKMKPLQPSIKPLTSLPDVRLEEYDLKDFPLSIMMYSGGHFVPAQVTDVKAPGIYEVVYLKNPRHRRPQILCSEELLNSAIREVKLDGLALPVGTRVCSYWSHEYNFMYSGIVSTSCGPADQFIFVEFDDGDDGKIDRNEIRLLPEELNLRDHDPEPSSPLISRRRRVSDSKFASDHPKSSPLAGEPRSSSPEETEHLDTVKGSSAEPDSDNGTAGPEEASDSWSDTPSIYIKNIVKGFLEMEKQKKEKRRLKKEKKQRLMEQGGKPHKHRHKKTCRSHHKQNLELRIKNSTVSKTGTESGSHTGPLVTTIAKPQLEIELQEDVEEDEPAADSSNNEVAKGSKFAAFLPSRHELWTWLGDGSKRGRGRGQKRGRKVFYKAIQRGSDIINVGDCAVFVSTGRPDRPFIGQVESFWGTPKNTMVVKVSWFYHPEETVGAPDVFPYPGALFKSPHTDSNDVQTISHRCEVVPVADFKSRVDGGDVSVDTVYDNQEVYYLAGYYDPQDTSIKYEPGALLQV